MTSSDTDPAFREAVVSFVADEPEVIAAAEDLIAFERGETTGEDTVPDGLSTVLDHHGLTYEDAVLALLLAAQRIKAAENGTN